ncbi:GTPase-associated protein 1-related protein [Streptomyces sp. CAU 1734]|uniref:GTPase-associated protein 1-related protein n=1 Tax=Streptomyces sp. CAU 1734 TaxID=3140360 RepID=UPI00326093EC
MNSPAGPPEGLPQLHHVSDASGPRFTSVDPRIPAGLLPEIGELLGCEPPRETPGRPAPGELPAALGHATLSDGSRLLCHTVHTEGHGFHAHALWLPADDSLPAGLLPVELWGSPHWSARTPQHRAPDPLTEPVPGRRINRAGLTAFAGARAELLPGFLADVRALFTDPAAPRLILAERDTHDTIQWIALAAAALPRKDAERLTFISYTRHPGRAPHHLVGTLPDTAAGTGTGRHRIHGAAGPPPAAPADDLWARVAARIWLAGEPRLFSAARRLPGEHENPDPGTGPRPPRDPYDPARLAVLAATTGVPLDSAGRAAAARWARRHGHGRGAEFWTPLLAGLAEGGDPRSPGEWLALAAVADRIAAGPAGALADELLAALAAVATAPPALVLALLDLAAALSVETMGIHPLLADRVTAALLEAAAGPEPAPPAPIAAVLDRRPELRAPVLAELDRAAAEAPGGPARVAAAVRAALPAADLAPTPHLHLGEAAGLRHVPGDPVRTFHTLLDLAGPAHRADPAVQRTAFRLAWPGRTPAPAEAGLLVNELAQEWLQSSGIGAELTRTALTAPAGDPDAPALAADLLRYAGHALDPRTRSALSLLALAGHITGGTAGPGFIREAGTLARTALPLEPAVAERAAAVIARVLLSDTPPPGELEELARSGDPVLLQGYETAARGDLDRGRPHAPPGRIAARFIDWTREPGASPAWEQTRTALLAEVLRPAVRLLPPEGMAEVTAELARAGDGLSAAFQEWNRPGRLARIRDRFR